MFEHLKDTVNCIACGKEEHITVKDVYDMSQTKNEKYRWKHAFQLPSLFQTLPHRSHYLKINPNDKGEFNARINMDCAETAVRLKIYAQKYIAAFEEKSVKGMNTKTLGRKRLYKQSASHSTNNILFDAGICTARNEQHCNEPYLSSISPSASVDTSVTTLQNFYMLSQN
ncbi:Uncharacterized protein BM_BM1609 [Brugia malayi]|uniref:Bm1609 n=1 Tax=Brugia malayi TaxID=6279 RepID=A0A0H5SE42_BRUMA|nr:Uncharacterized protein BM_BM1609 [Brugia malayi]CRZ26383.1 Bm1609 [Brugia malayi]VIO95143.1 Uncharacterized protein BM_BM1609 [Brugia malayi]